ncbi:hypothetical protein [Bacteriovorax sp. DB6_IX]|uniref:hypothetical protein n=1 Tax=Bacteriovorax sp. DB6_IX TaxID=1353530 RepID=UPI000389F0F5|nr:hypothetical protein [Bacteriovorax sp. DB6_IX]EQC45961.1 hypothetical protein M901_1061 [Bacteriovorax sp. DB6_IX]
MLTDKAFHIVEKTKFDSITMLRENHDELREITQKYLDNPKHLIINLAMSDNPTDEFLDQINFLSTLLKSENYSLQVFATPDNIQGKLKTHRLRNLPEMQDLSHYISSLNAIERELRIESLLKSYVDNTMKHVFSKSGLIIKRGELTIENDPENFLNQMNYFQTFELEDAFFSFVIGGSEEFFTPFLEAMKETELAPVLNSISSRVPDSLLKSVKIHDYLTHPYDSFPTEKISILGKEYSYFKNCAVMKVPLECDLGEFNLEVWIPKDFTAQVYGFLNP